MKTKKAPSDVGDKSVNKNEKSTEEEAEGGDTNEEEKVDRRGIEFGKDERGSWAKRDELTKFGHSNPVGWNARAEKSFEGLHMKPPERVESETKLNWNRIWRPKQRINQR